MDNAAKALIIAGGILIGMLIISLTMYLYTAFQDYYAKSMMIHNSYEIMAFNSEFTKYDNEISGADAFNILSRVYEVNNDDDSIINRIVVDSSSVISDVVNSSNFFEKYFYFSEKFHDRYNYSYTYNNEGIVNSVKITR